MHVRRPRSAIWICALLATAACARRREQPSPEYGRAEPGVAPLAKALQDTLHTILDRAQTDSAFPGAYAVVGTHAGVVAEYGVGHLDWGGTAKPDAHTLWDLASLTKVVGMTTGVMQLVEQGKLDLDAPLQRYIPEWTGPNKEKVTIRHLITHTSGLPAFKPYDQITTNADSIAKLMFATQLDTVPGARMVYSDIGAYMLGKLVERLSGETLDQYVKRHVFEPLGMTETGYNPSPALLARIAPTEIDPKRGGLVRGKVHDERAYYLGGVSAHAGIFSSAYDLSRFARMYLNGGELDGVRIVRPETIQQFTRRQVQDRALGWQKPTGTNSAGKLMTEAAFGHTGFTGTSIWMDPQRDLFVILLSNRVNPTRANMRIGAVRSHLADAVVSTILAASPTTQPARP